jgi:hypothetical protein
MGFRTNTGFFSNINSNRQDTLMNADTPEEYLNSTPKG